MHIKLSEIQREGGAREQKVGEEKMQKRRMNKGIGTGIKDERFTVKAQSSK